MQTLQRKNRPTLTLEDKEKMLFSSSEYRWGERLKLPITEGVYVIYHITPDRIVYVGESCNIFRRFKEHSIEKKNSAFIQNILARVKNAKDKPELRVQQFLDECCIKYIADTNRIPLKHYLIRKYKPRFNIQGNDAQI